MGEPFHFDEKEKRCVEKFNAIFWTLRQREVRIFKDQIKGNEKCRG
jgi:hypothetical protein